MTAEDDRPPLDGWTPDDLERFSGDDLRHEVFDGVILRYPAPPAIHQVVAGRLMEALSGLCPPANVVGRDVQVRFGERRCFVPDVLVLATAAAGRIRPHYEPRDVVLAVEVVSPNSLTMDRITKPKLYAAAGIPFYWRVETDGEIAVHSYRLDPAGSVYRESGAFRDVIRVDEPWPIEMSIGRLTLPRPSEDG